MTQRHAPLVSVPVRRVPRSKELVLLLLLCMSSSLVASASFAQEAAPTPSWDRRLQFSNDVIAAVQLVGSDQILGVGEFGMVALITFNGSEVSKAELVETDVTEDLMDVVALPDGSALVASASGNILRFENGTLSQVQNIGNDAVLTMGVRRDSSGNIRSIWAAGGRGILAVSRDGGKTFQDAAPDTVNQPPLPFPNTNPGVWFTGVANILRESIVLAGNVNGRPAELDKDFIVSEDGVIEIVNELDAEPAPTITFDFRPGAAFQAGDFTISTMVFQGDLITAAGEFGLILQSEDDGATWARRGASLSARDPDLPYWIDSTGKGDTIVLVGAAGANQRSDDRGVTWSSRPQPAGTAGIFGTHLLANSSPLIVGAVGLLGEVEGEGWKLVDRSALELYSWLKPILVLEDNTLLALGGRGSCVFRKGNSGWERCQIRLNDDNA